MFVGLQPQVPVNICSFSLLCCKWWHSCSTGWRCRSRGTVTPNQLATPSLHRAQPFCFELALDWTSWPAVATASRLCSI